jgi:hypothetical protein
VLSVAAPAKPENTLTYQTSAMSSKCDAGAQRAFTVPCKNDQLERVGDLVHAALTGGLNEVKQRVIRHAPCPVLTCRKCRRLEPRVSDRCWASTPARILI